MKQKRYSILALVVALAVFLCLPVSAQTYGVIYDETESLGSQPLTLQGETNLPECSQKLGLDLRVDVLTEIINNNIGETAMALYDEYGYGYGDNKEGLTLTIWMQPQDNGSYAMPSADSWCVYGVLDEGRGDSQALSDTVRNAIQPYMAERAWNGEDINMSAVALTQAVDAMIESATQYVMANCPPAGATEGTTGTAGSDEEIMRYVIDTSEKLSYDQWKELENKAADIAKRSNCGVYVFFVDDYADYVDSGDDVDAFDATAAIYHEYGFGIGNGHDGIAILLSMKDRDYALYYYGAYAESVFTNEAQAAIEEACLGDFGNDDWYLGTSHYLEACDLYLSQAAPNPAAVTGTEVPGAASAYKEAAEYIFDRSDLLTDEQWQTLEAKAADISDRHECNTYFALVDDFTVYGDAVEKATYQLYHNENLGKGSGRDGIIVLLSMKERDYAMFVYGKQAEYAFNKYGQKELEDTFLGDFGDNNWYIGISHYLDSCDEFMTKAESGKPVQRSYWIWYLVVVLGSCLIAGVVCLILRDKMITVQKKVEANEYVAAGGLTLTLQYDRYTHTTETRTKVKSESSDSGSSTSSYSGGGGSGRSGKF